MAWRDQKRAASFRGVPFEAVTDSQPAGQRTQVHEYPQRDKPLVEPLGKKTNEIKFRAFVAGDDCLDRRDKLLAAIEEPGAGELIHPWFGSLTVSCTGCEVSHSSLEQGVVRFELTFVEGEAEPAYPVAGEDAASVLNAAADDVQTSALDRFTEALEGIDLSQVRLDAVLTPIGQVVSVVQDVYGTVTGVIDTAQGVIDQVLAGPTAFANALFGALGGAQASFAGFYGRIQGAASLFGLGNRLDGLLRLGETSSPGGQVNGTFVRAIRSLVQDAVAADVIRGVAVLPSKVLPAPATGAVAVDAITPRSLSVDMSNAGQVVAGGLGVVRVEPPVADDVLALRDDLSDGFWALAEDSPPAHYQVIAAGRTAAVRQLVAVSRLGVRLTRIDNPAPVPALVLAYRRYGDAARAADIVARNSVSHPGFVPAGGLMVPRA